MTRPDERRRTRLRHSTRQLPRSPSDQRVRCVVPAPEPRSRKELLRTATLFRELNDALQVYFRSDGNTYGEFVCECSDSTCVDQLLLTRTEYADVRGHPTRFFVVAGHEREDLERVVEQSERFLVVQKPVVP